MQKETEPIVGLRKLEAVKGFPDESVDKLSGTEPDVSSEFPNQVGRRTMADIDLECSIVEHILETNASDSKCPLVYRSTLQNLVFPDA